MTFSRAGVLALVALGVMAANVALSILYMVVYSYAIDPGHDKAYYEAHIKVAAPYCSIVAGIPLMFLVGWWLGVREAITVWLIYAVIDVAIIVASGMTPKLAVLVAVSMLTKLGAAWLGGLAAGGPEPVTAP